MADIAIWGGSSTFQAGQTPFAFYDNDSDFQADADKVAKFCAQRLGYPLMDVELQSGSFYACFEEAVTTYGNEVFQYKIRENYLSMEGDTTGSSYNNKLIITGEAVTENKVDNFRNYIAGSLNLKDLEEYMSYIPRAQTPVDAPR